MGDMLTEQRRRQLERDAKELGLDIKRIRVILDAFKIKRASYLSLKKTGERIEIYTLVRTIVCSADLREFEPAEVNIGDASRSISRKTQRNAASRDMAKLHQD